MSGDGLSVLVADDDESVREALADLISSTSDLRLVAVAGDHAETVRLAVQSRPDVAVMDVRMPNGSGPDTVHAINQLSPGTAVIALSAYEDAESVVGMLASGVVGYQVKGSADTELLEAIRRAHRGQLSMPVDLVRSFRRLLRDRGDSADDRPPQRAREEQFHALLDGAPLGVVLVSPDGLVRVANAESDRIFGRALADMVGQPAFSLLTRPFRSDFLTRLALAGDEDDGDQSVGVTGLRGDGTEFAAAVDLRSVRLGEEHLVAMFVRSLSDVEETEDRYQQPGELSDDAVLVIDPTGRIELVDAQTESFFGYRRDELLGRPIGLLLPGRSVAVYLQHRATGATRGPAQGGRTSLALDGKRKDGTEFPVDVGVSALHDGDQRLMVVVIRDMSEQRRYERVLEQSFHVLQDMDRDHKLLLNHLVRAQEEERMRIAAGIHDDTLQAITAASLRLQQLRRRLRRPDDVDLLSRLEETIQLSISRLRHLTFDLQPPVSEGGLASSVSGYLDQLGADTGIDVHLDNSCRAELSPETVVVAYRITQEALNNIRKHARASTVHVRLRNVDDGCLVTIEDDGVGYAPGPTESKPGHLGLTLMQERAQISGGWCRIESEPGAGTTVEFWLPGDSDVVHGDQRRQAALGLRP